MLGVTFVAGITGSVLAQGQPAPAAPAPATASKEEKKVEKPAEPKKPAAHNASGTVKTAAADSLVVSQGQDGQSHRLDVARPKTRDRKAGKD